MLLAAVAAERNLAGSAVSELAGAVKQAQVRVTYRFLKIHTAHVLDENDVELADRVCRHRARPRQARTENASMCPSHQSIMC